jgi:hypothetical protein
VQAFEIPTDEWRYPATAELCMSTLAAWAAEARQSRGGMIGVAIPGSELGDAQTRVVALHNPDLVIPGFGGRHHWTLVQFLFRGSIGVQRAADLFPQAAGGGVASPWEGLAAFVARNVRPFGTGCYVSVHRGRPIQLPGEPFVRTPFTVGFASEPISSSAPQEPPLCID